MVECPTCGSQVDERKLITLKESGEVMGCSICKRRNSGDGRIYFEKRFRDTSWE